MLQAVVSLCSVIADADAIFKKVNTNNDVGDYNRSDSKSNTINKKIKICEIHEICGFALKLMRCYNDQDDLPA